MYIYTHIIFKILHLKHKIFENYKLLFSIMVYDKMLGHLLTLKYMSKPFFHLYITFTSPYFLLELYSFCKVSLLLSNHPTTLWNKCVHKLKY